MLIAMKCPKQAYERDPEVLHLYVKDIRLLTPNYEQEKSINKTVKLRKLVLGLYRVIDRGLADIAFSLPVLFLFVLASLFPVGLCSLEIF
jgi:hypothetical protein